ncbi:TPA: hypothetical protein P0N76_000229 [Yersinia enterocolitica]|uniref:hypothetical protein n=1 Tax=Yersinia enterocolitica TaxID=630 RepID=UPI0029C44AFA|nr:hypothetical protein [Yersinia enterocolitica]EKN5979513.1 hypothetical protein [Yersinia enterocolitica]EKN6380637.1 hypothetical protein [Yersinia enterocolitica]HDM8275881.1 hypothetical protein [Yersinia enterocolitica]HEI6925587.1 hypothetical protein [Yersinia enterocolitica]
MTIEIKYVKDAGDIKKERLVLKVVSDDQIGNYVTFDTTYFDDGTVSNSMRHSFWFPDREVKENDLIIVYTRNGQDSRVENKNGTTSHFFYMGLDKSIWNKDGDCAVLMKIASWQHKKINKEN